MIVHKFSTMKYEALIVKASESFIEINSMNIRIHGEIGEIILYAGSNLLYRILAHAMLLQYKIIISGGEKKISMKD